jgi:hypothetical protein
MDQIQLADQPPQLGIEAIKNHPFEYGYSHALRQPDSYISKEGSEFILHFTPPSIDSPLWYGDCATDVLLTTKAANQSNLTQGLTAEKLLFQDPVSGFTFSHYRAHYNGVSLDHSLFYTSISESYITFQADITGQVDPAIELISSYSLSRGDINLRDFKVENNTYLTMIGVEEVPDTKERLTRVNIIELDAEGKIKRRYCTVQRTNSTNTSSPRTDKLTHRIIDVSGENYVDGYDDPVIDQEMHATIDLISSAINRNRT